LSDRAARIAETVLYEGYLLWPYRRSALKNQARWTFGAVFPPAWNARHPDDAATMRTQCLLQADGEVDVDVTVRFLQVVWREADDEYLAWDTAIEREVGPGPFVVDGLMGSVDVEIAGQRISVTIRNTTPWSGTEREDALRSTFCSTHTVLRGGRFLSATEAPECENIGTWPVLVGEDTMLSSPIILEDHPRIAPESPGDLFDGGEIDGLLALNILALTDAEKAEMRATDPRTREILERTEALTPEQLWRLSGYRREL
jgi:hypothetical protein